jgi:hypothetical protein
VQNVIRLSVILLSFVKPNVFILSIIMLNVIMMTANMMNVIMLHVIAPTGLVVKLTKSQIDEISSY